MEIQNGINLGKIVRKMNPSCHGHDRFEKENAFEIKEKWAMEFYKDSNTN